MAETPDPALLAEVEDLRDEIALKEAILESLTENGYGSEDEDLRKTTRKELKRLRKHLRALQPKAEEEEDATQDSNALSQVPEATGDDEPLHNPSQSLHQANRLMPPAPFDLVNRKRQRGLDDERPESSKSRRNTPSSTRTPASPAASSASVDSLDDPSLDFLFGGLSQEELEQNQKFWKQKERQDEDAKIAQSLSQGFTDTSFVHPMQPTAPRPLDYTQSFLRLNGAKVEASEDSRPPKIFKPEPGSASGTLPNVPDYLQSTRLPMIGSSYNAATSNIARPSQPAKPEPPGAMYIARHAPFTTPSIKHEQNPGSVVGMVKLEPGLGQSPSMPGAFPNPSMPAPYSSIGGSSVYSLNGDVQLGSNGLPQAYMPYPGYLGMLQSDDSDSDASRRRLYGHTDPAQTQEEIRQLLQHIRPDEELTADHMPLQPQGLKVPLMPHQLSGHAWMKRMEEGSNKGGILADDMGLGKTLQAIALMLERPPPPDKHRPTLVVAPVALMQQWKREIEKMVRPRHRMEVFILHGETRKATWSSLKAYDVILTTYGLLASEMKRKLVLDEKVKRLENYVPTFAEDCPVLGDRSKFHRVILDEAHNIKNRTTKAAIAACRIESEYRWCLSGTPMMNNAEELYSLVKFLRIRPYCLWERFRRDIVSPLKSRSGDLPDRGMKTLQALLKAILLRRNKKSTIHGQPILQLPPKETREDRVVFGKDQNEFYFALERNSQVVMNRYIQAGTVGRHYANVLVLLLRLRQACCHPHLVTASKDFVQLPGGELDTGALMRNANKLAADVVERLKQLDAYECPICFDVTENPSVFLCGHAICGDCLSKLVDDSNNNSVQPKCPHCRANIDVDNVTDYMSFLRVHCPDHELVNNQNVEPDDDDEASDSDSDSESDSSDSDEGDDLGGFIVPDTDIESDAESSHAKQPQKKKKKKKHGHKSKSKSKGKAKAKDLPQSLAVLRKEGLRSKSARKKYLKRLKKTFEPSAKTNHTLQILQQIKDNGENEKTIIFSNFTSFLDIIETALYDKKDFCNYVRYDGSMNAQDRNDAVLEFTENPRCTIILVSLRAGNAGLNLTVANHVIMLDPFWNPFVEYQAADRCHRIGQMRPVTVHRVLIGPDETEGVPVRPPARDGEDQAANTYTVEDRILNLQEKKRRLVETALDENAGQAMSRLGVRELGYLFGLNNL